ncbi:ABC-type cobalamin/Fe3+-siderophores transport systems, ATPase component [Thermoplasmatales archaeon BRNA1]|nr:ABC-type cobalamin/Fe3+-siderophores transport systems, ATPase component [Thermoplasmatales archaeon BRNA1]
MLKCLCGMYKPASGSVEVNGKAVSTLRGKELAKEIAFVPQSTPATRTTVFDTVLLGRKPYIDWYASKEDYEKVESVLTALKMEDLALKYADQISGGELQKAQIARAIVQEPSVLILDEPSNNLDIANQHRTMHMIMDLVRSRGMSTIMTMHDINLAVHYSDKFLFVKDGKARAYGGVEIITEELIKDVYNIDSEIIYHRGVPLVVPMYSSKYTHDHEHEHTHDIHDHLVGGKDSDWEAGHDPFE